MAFEVVVRPVVMPDIRPAPAQPVPPADDPTKGICTIRGSNGKFLDLAYSWSASTSQNNQSEFKRRVDVARVYQMDDEENVNRDNFVDIEVANTVWYKYTDGTRGVADWMPVREAPNTDVFEYDKMKYREPGFYNPAP